MAMTSDVVSRSDFVFIKESPIEKVKRERLDDYPILVSGLALTAGSLR